MTDHIDEAVQAAINEFKEKGAIPTDQIILKSVLDDYLLTKETLGITLKEKISSEDQAENLYRQLCEAEEKSITDGLTGLFNQSFFRASLAKELSLAKRESTPLSLIFSDLDNFKVYNDVYGHLQGDETLKTVASIFQDSIREADIAARYGGEEFVIILPSTDSAGAETIAKNLLNTIRNEVIAWKIPNKTPPDEKFKFVTISAGIVTYHPKLETVLGFRNQPINYKVDKIIHLADEALYASKHAGRDRYTIANIGE